MHRVSACVHSCESIEKAREGPMLPEAIGKTKNDFEESALQDANFGGKVIPCRFSQCPFFLISHSRTFRPSRTNTVYKPPPA